MANFNVPRATYEECLQQIYKDLDSASFLLPFDYGDIAEGGTVPAKFGNVARTDYNRVYGNNFRGGLLSGRIAMAVKAKTSIIAASPAFSSGNTTTWENAAHDAAAILDLINGPSGLAATGLEWYGGTPAIADQINGLSVGVNPRKYFGEPAGRTTPRVWKGIIIRLRCSATAASTLLKTW
ncbi:RagB/SusD family nutrient uptake outer membrane protein [Niabella defluvii]|nr:RagB/SusD family nutrient uptake outer membrane protein [Niabella sp. I65]